MKQKIVLMLIGALGTLAQAQVPSSYLCVAEKASGFAFDKRTKQWDSSTFRVSNKYLISRSKNKDFFWEVKEVGKQAADIVCTKDFNDKGNLFCGGFGSEFRFNSGSLRYMNTYFIGYWSDANPKDKSNFMGEEGSNTPSMEIGKCSPL